jgi:hypothetical protein
MLTTPDKSKPTTKTIAAAGKTCHQSDTLGPRREQSYSSEAIVQYFGDSLIQCLKSRLSTNEFKANYFTIKSFVSYWSSRFYLLWTCVFKFCNTLLLCISKINSTSYKLRKPEIFKHAYPKRPCLNIRRLQEAKRKFVWMSYVWGRQYKWLSFPMFSESEYSIHAITPIT